VGDSSGRERRREERRRRKTRGQGRVAGKGKNEKIKV
jgi:hypothetical protein